MHLGYLILALVVVFVGIMLWAIYYAVQHDLLDHNWDWTDSEF